jgi:hypothetical protein
MLPRQAETVRNKRAEGIRKDAADGRTIGDLSHAIDEQTRGMAGPRGAL